MDHFSQDILSSVEEGACHQGFVLEYEYIVQKVHLLLIEVCVCYLVVLISTAFQTWIEHQIF